MIKFRINEPTISQLEKEYVMEVLEKNWLSAGGNLTEDFESLVTHYLGVKHGIAVQSGTAALHLALKAVGVRENDHIVIPNYSCGATISSVKQCNAIPIVVDIDPDTYGLDINKLEEVIKNYKIKAMQFVHVYGFPAFYTQEIIRLCRENEIIIIEDAAESLGAKVYGEMAGSIGDISILSIRSEKMIGVGEGGVLLTNNTEYFNNALKLASRNAPFRGPESPYWDKYYYEGEGYNYRLPHLLGALAKAQMERFESEILPEKIRVGELYRSELKDNNSITLQKIVKDSSSCFWLNSILLKNYKTQFVRDLGIYLESQGIEVRSGFWPLSKMNGFSPIVYGSQEVGQMLYDKLLVLPSSTNLKKADIKFIINHITGFIEENTNEN